MSHPNPSHDHDNQYPEDGVTNYKSKGKLKKMARKSPKKSKNDDDGIDMMPFFRKQASQGKNPFSLITHVGKKRIK